MTALSRLLTRRLFGLIGPAVAILALTAAPTEGRAQFILSIGGGYPGWGYGGYPGIGIGPVGYGGYGYGVPGFGYASGYTRYSAFGLGGLGYRYSSFYGAPGFGYGLGYRSPIGYRYSSLYGTPAFGFRSPGLWGARRLYRGPIGARGFGTPVVGGRLIPGFGVVGGLR